MALSVGLAFSPVTASADHLTAELGGVAERGFAPVQELSYETIVEPSTGYDAVVKIRVALHNDSAKPRDAVLAMALPRSAEITGLRVARDGVWTDGLGTKTSPAPGPRDPGTVFVRPMSPQQPGDLPGAEIVAFGLDAGATIQVELALRVFPRLRAGRWEVALPARGRALRALARQRRIAVNDTPEFWVDDNSNRGQSVVRTRSDYETTVAWPASIRSTGVFDGQYEVTPDAFGGGQLKVLLRLGSTRAPRPDHLALVVDQSHSTSSHLQSETVRVADALFSELPDSTTFDAVGFARGAKTLMQGDRRPPLSDETARTELRRAMDANHRAQGSDVATGLELAIQRMAGRGARRPMLVVFTDGMLPTTVSPTEVRDRVKRAVEAADTRAPEILFVVDEPLRQRGVSADEPIAQIAAALGARISHRTLSRVRGDSVLELLAAPLVLGQLAVHLPDRIRLHHKVPDGLVAGNFAVVDGSYDGAPPRSVKISGRMGTRKVSRRLRLKRREAPPQALVASTATSASVSAQEGFSLPPWYGHRDRRVAQLSITNAGRGGAGQRGTLTPSIVQHYLQTRVWPRAGVCYNRAVARNQVQGGRVVLQFEIGKGEVMMARPSSVKLERPDPEFLNCLAEAAWALDIPAAKLDDRTYILRYPLQFRPPKNGQPPRTTDPLGAGTVELLLRAGGPRKR
jgi:hypothetical protein